MRPNTAVYKMVVLVIVSPFSKESCNCSASERTGITITVPSSGPPSNGLQRGDKSIFQTTSFGC